MKRFAQARVNGGSNYDSLVIFNQDQAAVIDVTVHSDGADPDTEHGRKVEKYSGMAELNQRVRQITGHTPTYSAFAVNWRGVISGTSAREMLNFGLRKYQLELLSVCCVEWGTAIYRHFSQSTLRVRRPGQRH